MRRRIGLLAAYVAVLSSCGLFSEVSGPGTPECGSAGVTANAVTLLQAQAVPTAFYGPCISELRVGWTYSTQEAESGRATFWLDSDRMGDHFVAVSLLESCDPRSAIQSNDPFDDDEEDPLDDVDRFVDVRVESGPVEILVVPVAQRHESNAENVAAGIMGRRIEERSVLATVAPSGEASRQIQAGLADRLAVIVIDDLEVDTRTLELRRFGEEPRTGVSLDEALEEIEDDVEEPRYEATWYHTFEGGCIIYEFDAEGFGSETLSSDIDDSLGLFPLEALRQLGRDAGFDI